MHASTLNRRAFLAGAAGVAAGRLNAPFFLPAGQRKPKFIGNQTGGSPIVKNKLFYFASYDGQFFRQFASQIVTVPAAAIRAGACGRPGECAAQRGNDVPRTRLGPDPVFAQFHGRQAPAGAQQLRDFAGVEGIRIGIHTGVRPRRVLLAPERRPIAFEWKDGRVWFQTQRLVLHDVYIIEGLRRDREA